MTAWTELGLAENHRQQLLDSGIAPDVAAERGYRTANAEADVPDVFNSAQRKLVPAMVIPQWGVDDTAEPVVYELRPDNPREYGKARKIRKYEYPAKAHKVLDVPKRMRERLGDPSADLFLTEGSKKADAGASLDLLTVSLSGVWSFRTTNDVGGKVELPDFDKIAFNGRKVYLAFDSDIVMNPQVQKAMTRLSGLLSRREAEVYVVVIPHGPHGAKQGLDDLIAAGADQAAIYALAVPASEYLADERPLDIRFRDHVIDNYRLGQDTEGNAFAVPINGPRVVRMLSTGRPSLEIEAPELFSAEDAAHPVMPRHLVKDVMAGVAGRCLTAPVQRLHLRTAKHEDGIVIDLGDNAGSVIGVTAGGWAVGANRTDVLFRRTENVAPLPVPERGGSLDELRAFLNVNDETWPLIMGWLIASVFGWIPRPWLLAVGPQGSGKTDGALLTLSVLDPRTELDSAPRQGDRGDPGALASGSYLVGYDNVSKVSAEFSDWLCALITGARDSRRVLHTTSTMVSLSFMRSGALTSVGMTGVRPDLTERLLRVEFDRLSNQTRRSHRMLMDRFTVAHPRILGALLDAVSVVLANLPEIDEQQIDVPRMVDYAMVLAAYDRGAGTALLDAYRTNVQQAMTDLADDDSVASVVIAYVAEHGVFEGMVTDLLIELNQFRSAHHTDDDDPDAYWPKSAKLLGTELRKMTATVEDRVRITWPKRGKQGQPVRLAPVSPGMGAESGVAGAASTVDATPLATPAQTLSDQHVSNETASGVAGVAKKTKYVKESVSFREGEKEEEPPYKESGDLATPATPEPDSAETHRSGTIQAGVASGVASTVDAAPATPDWEARGWPPLPDPEAWDYTGIDPDVVAAAKASNPPMPPEVAAMPAVAALLRHRSVSYLRPTDPPFWRPKHTPEAGA